MEGFRRYAVYVVPGGAIYEFGASWLGWDCVAGAERAHPDLPDLPAPVEELTATPRKYGFHGTIKPPFRLAGGKTPTALSDALSEFCAGRTPVTIPRLAVRRLGGFVACVPAEPFAPLSALAADAVRDLDPFRAPMTEGEAARRRKPGLTARQAAMLEQWGYPFVMEEFRFHMTLSGRLGRRDADLLAARLSGAMTGLLNAPFVIDSLALLGEAEDGRFHLLHRAPLSG